ncbi:MAG TPA: hypothetical protein VIM16_20550 [Mucilaginibacter sp.]
MIRFIISLLNIFLLIAGINIFLNSLVASALSRTLRMFSSIIIALAIISFLYFLMLVLNQELTFLLILLSGINLFNLYWTYPALKKSFSYKNHTINYAGIIVPLAAILLMSVFFIFHGSKYGYFDAWAIWNTHAKFLYHPQIWTRMFSDGKLLSHADYPLMLPSLVAFFWKIINNTSFIIPLLFSFSTLIAVVLLLYYALLVEFQSKIYAYFALFILVADYNFQLQNTSQSADTLLSLFILLAFVLNNRFRRSSSYNLAYIIGFICAGCTWIKNEGDLFYMVFTAVFFISNYKCVHCIIKYLAGSIVPLFVTIYFKVILAPANDLVTVGHNSIPRIIGDLKDVHRYFTIFRMSAKILIDNFWAAIIIVFLLLLFNRNFFKSFPFIVFSILFSGFILIYLTTPYNLEWHLYTSLFRLLYQIYPSLLYVSIIGLGNVLSKKSDFDLGAVSQKLSKNE